MLDSLIGAANASAPTGTAGGFNIMGLLPFLAVFVIMYFMIIRPQNKRSKEHQMMVEGIKRGDRVLTAGGLIGVVTQVVDNTEVSLELAPGVEVRALKSSIGQVLSKTGSASTPSAEKKSKSKKSSSNDAS